MNDMRRLHLMPRPIRKLRVLCLLSCALGFGLLPPSTSRSQTDRATAADVYSDDDTERVTVRIDGRPTRGPADAPITVVIFAEFEDPFIGAAQPTLAALASANPGAIRFVFRHRPLDFHAGSMDAARAAEEAFAQGGDAWFWAMHDRLLQNRQALDRTSLVQYAADLGLDTVRFERALDDGRHDAVIQRDRADAERLEAAGSPTFFINGVRITGAQPREAFETIVSREMTLARRAMDRGAARGDIYALAMAHPHEPAPPAGERAAADGSADSASATDAPIINVPVARDQPTRGRRNALVTIVEFSDFQCPFCGRVQPTLRELETRYGADIRIVYRHLPLPFHQHAQTAAEAAMEAYAQRGDPGFWAMHDLLFANQRQLDRAHLEQFAAQIGLDLPRFRRALDTAIHADRVRADKDAADALGVRGTPGFFINGRFLRGAQPTAAFVSVVDRALEDARAARRGGVPASRVYAHLVSRGLDRIPSVPSQATPPSRPRRDPDAVHRVPIASDNPVRGPNDALVTIVVFSDFECPFCARLVPTLDRLRQDYGADLRIVFRHNPLPFHRNAALAAEAAIEAHAQGGDPAFWLMHDLLFANQRQLTRADLESYATQIGLDLTRFRDALDRHVHAARVDADRQLATQLGARGTPNSFVNGRFILGAQPHQVWVDAVERAKREAEGLIRRGVPRRRVYERITGRGSRTPVMLPSP